MTAFIMVAVYLGLTCIISLINKNRQSSTRNTFVAKNGMSACTLIPLLFGELIAGAGTVGNASEAFMGQLGSSNRLCGICCFRFTVLL